VEIREELEKRVNALEDRMAPKIEAVKESLSTLNEKVVGFVKEHPAKTLLGAIAFGYLAGRIARGVAHHGSK
jgi:ElaB/YqjD/DUF883 family membrane-anchored ribosome-binding protein